MKKLISIICAITLMLSLSAACSASKEGATNPAAPICLDDYPKHTRERFVASLAIEDNLSYEAADLSEAAASQKIVLGDDETIKYYTVDKLAGNIKGSTMNQDVYITAEVRYRCSNATDEAVEIETVGEPTIYLDGVAADNATFGNSDRFNKEIGATSARISITTTVIIQSEDADVSVGGDIAGVTSNVNGSSVASRAKTFVLKFDLDDLL